MYIVQHKKKILLNIFNTRIILILALKFESCKIYMLRTSLEILDIMEFFFLFSLLLVLHVLYTSFRPKSTTFFTINFKFENYTKINVKDYLST